MTSSTEAVAVTRNAGKSLLFIDSPSGVSYEDAAREHRARRENLGLGRCEAGHLSIVPQWGEGWLLVCQKVAAFEETSRGRLCGRRLEQWERVK